MKHKNNLYLLKIIGVVEMSIGASLLWWGVELPDKYWYVLIAAVFFIAGGRSWYFAHCISNQKYKPRAD